MATICVNESLFIGNDNSLVVDQVQDSLTGEYINTATVTASLVDSDGAEVEPQLFPMTLVYIPDSNGQYAGVLQDTLQLVDGDAYTVIVDIDSGELQAHFETPVRAAVRS